MRCDTQNWAPPTGKLGSGREGPRTDPSGQHTNRHTLFSTPRKDGNHTRYAYKLECFKCTSICFVLIIVIAFHVPSLNRLCLSFNPPSEALLVFSGDPFIFLIALQDRWSLR